MGTKHNIVLGSFSFLLITFIIVNGYLTFQLFERQDNQLEILTNEINQLKVETQSQINSLSNNLMQTNEKLLETAEKLNVELSSIGDEVTLLKASAGDDFSGIIEDSVLGVVTIRTDISQGTGFLITEDGYIVTNLHVLENAKKLGILTSDQSSKGASLIGYDEDFDIALLKAEGNFEKLKIGNSNSVSVGEKVIAIGNPLGLQFSVSQGIISGVERIGINGEDAYFQTDAALNPGNSGGPLINTKGEVIGINNFKIGGGESLGFALESNYIKDIVNDISNDVLNQTLIN